MIEGRKGKREGPHHKPKNLHCRKTAWKREKGQIDLESDPSVLEKKKKGSPSCQLQKGEIRQASAKEKDGEKRRITRLKKARVL